MTSKLKKTIKKIDPLMGGDVILDKIGLPSMFGDEFGFVQDEPKIAEQAGSVASAPATPTAVSDETLEARDAQRKRQLAAAGMGGTVLTGSSGLASAAPTSGKSLLGS